MVSPDLLEKLAAYVPTPVAQALYHQPLLLTKPIARRFPAVVLFSDISGFTPLSELLGPAGVEELTGLINQYFTRMIQIIQAYHGQVVKFSGDAMTILFPAEKLSMSVALHRAGTCALAMQAAMHGFSKLKTSRGPASLSMKVGIGAGKILECSIGGRLGRWEYVVGGDPLVQVATANHQAQPGQIILSPQAWEVARKFFIGASTPNSHGYVKLGRAITPYRAQASLVFDWTQLNLEQRTIAEQTLQCYIPGAIKARLGSQSDWLAELRRMVILFIGIGGLDYEARDAAARLQNLLQATQELIYRFEGSLNKVAIDDKGTVFLILFGAPPFSHEDNSARAVACALGLQTVAREQNLRMSIGITEGSIFAGPVGAPNRREYTVIGDEVNLAARLMQYGRAGTIIISDQVKERVGSRFIIENLGQISVKGKVRAPTAYLVKGEQGGQGEFVSRYLLHEDPLIGRKAELEQIRRMTGRARENKLQVLFIEGELGLGKSRLVSEMVREWLMSGSVGYGSKCISYDQRIPYQAWREVLMAIYGLTPNLSPERQLARLAAGVAELEDPPGQPGYWADRLPLLADVLGLELIENDFTHNISGQLRRNNTFALIEALLRRQAERHALLILLEDIHWADELSLSLAAYLAKSLLNTSLLLVLVHRPISDTGLGPLADIKNLPYTNTIHLEPLSTEESLDLIKILLGDRELSPEAREILLSRGQGNPFFLQEITGAILDVAKSQAGPSLKLPETLNLPGTVQDVILSRIDRLSEAKKLILKVASVIGTSFQRSLLSAVHPVRQTNSFLATQLDDLERENLIRLQAPAPKWEYIFRNVITQEVVYEGLLLAQRRQLHSTVGAALEKLVPDEVERLAFHYSRSHNQEKALYYLEIAGDKARREYANQTAIDYYSALLNCLEDTSFSETARGDIISTKYWDTLLKRVKLYHLIGQRDETLEDLGTLGIMGEALQDDYRRALAAKQWTDFYETSGDYDAGLEMIERAVQLAEQAKDKKLVGEGYNQWGRLLYLCGEYETAFDYLQRALHIAQNQHDQSAQVDCLNNLGIVAHYQTDYEVALYFFQEAIALWRNLSDQVYLSNSLSNLGRVYYDLGDYIAAQTCYDEALTLHRTIGDRAGEALTRRSQGKVQRRLGNYPLARNLLEEALAIHQSIGDRPGEARGLCQLGFLYSRLEEYETALAFLEEALVILRELNDPWALGNVLTYYGWTLIDKGEPQTARKYLEEAIQVERDIQQEAAAIEDLVYLGRAALACHELSLANDYAQEAFSFIEQHGTKGMEYPGQIYLTCYQILQANQKFEQARLMLEKGQEYIARQAAQIADPALRHCYLNNIPENRKLQALDLHLMRG